MCLVLLWSLVHLLQGCRAAPGGQSCERRMDAEWQGVATALSAPGAMGGAAVHAVGAWSEPRTSLGVGAPSDTAAPWPCAAHPGCGGCRGTRGHGAGTRCAASPLPPGLAKCRPSPWGRHGAGSILGALAEQLVISPYTAWRWLHTAISASSSTHGSFL